MNTSSYPRSSQGFTLIELLTVIAIVGILAAILIPAIGKAKASARMVNDMSNLREIGKAVGLSWTEWRNMMPYHMNTKGQVLAGESNTTASGSGSDPTFPIYQTIDRYFPTNAGYNPSGQYQYKMRATWFATNANVPDEKTITPSSPYGGFAQFAFNPYIWTNGGLWHARMSNVPSPPRTVLMAESNNPLGKGDSDLDPTAEPVTDPSVACSYRITQPGNKALYLWADLHVTAMVGNQNFSVNPTIWRWW